MKNPITHEIDLIEGYTDDKGVVHKHVVFGKSVTAKQLLELRTDPQASVNTQYEDLLLAKSITEFGALPMPVNLKQLLGLKSIDREDLRAGRDAFRRKIIGDRQPSFDFDTGVATLLFGIKVGDLHYTHIQFGNDLTGYDEVAADKAGMTEPLARRAFLAGRMATQISTPEGASIEGPLAYETICSENVDEDDLFGLVTAAEYWRQTFRVRRETASKTGPAKNDSVAGNENRMDASGDSSAAAGGD